MPPRLNFFKTITLSFLDSSIYFDRSRFVVRNDSFLTLMQDRGKIV